MHGLRPALIAGASFWGLFLSGVEATGHHYVNTSTPITLPSVSHDLSVTLSIISSTIITDIAEPTSLAPPDFIGSVPSNFTTSDTSTSEIPSTSPVPVLPTTSEPALNATSTFLYPNTTAPDVLLPTSTNPPLNASAPYLLPNQTTTEHPPSTASIGLPHPLNTSIPTRHYENTTATQSRWFTRVNQTRTHSTGPTPPPAVLTPALPPSLDPHDPVILQPNRSVNLYFQAPRPSNGSEIPMASVDIPKMAYPAVVLDHSALIADMECDLRKLRMKFLHRSALDVAEGSWTMPKFVMMAFHEKCGRASQTGERDYLLVEGLKFDHKKLEVAADIKHIGVVEAVGKENPITVDMGSYTPNSLNGTTGFDTQAGQVIRNGTRTTNTASADFDVGLDDAIGYTTVSTSQNIKRFTGLDPSKHLIPRGWCGICDKVIKTVKKVVNKFIPSWTLTPLNKNLDIALGGGNVDTPFSGKKGYQLYAVGSGTNYLRLYCVACGVNGVINVKATVTFNLVGLITSGSFSANGWLRAGLGLGVDASYAASIPAFSKTIVAIPLSPFSIPGLITIGPHLDFGVGASAGINAQGNLYAGIALVWPAVHAQLNLYSAPTASGWIPNVVPEFQAQGQVTMSASVYATVSIGFGVSILNGLKSFGVALVEKPELWVSGQTTYPTCRGLRVSAGFKNSVYADVFGSHHNINVWNGPSAEKCVTIRKRGEDFKTLPVPMSKRGDARQIKTADGTIGVHYADNGNLYALPHGNGSLVDMSTIFFSSTGEGILTGDVESRVFHGYSDTLSSTGVSRFRLSRPDHIPKTSLPVTLQKSSSSENPNILVARDAAHNVYYPVVCTFGEKDFPRMFLTKNPDEGAGILTDEARVGDVTGVKAEACAYIPLVSV